MVPIAICTEICGIHIYDPMSLQDSGPSPPVAHPLDAVVLSGDEVWLFHYADADRI